VLARFVFVAALYHVFEGDFVAVCSPSMREDGVSRDIAVDLDEGDATAMVEAQETHDITEIEFSDEMLQEMADDVATPAQSGMTTALVCCIRDNVYRAR
jgi:hypothetical protein